MINRPMDISTLGEFALIDLISKKIRNAMDEDLIGIGDDCAVIPQNEKQSLLVSTDMLVEDVHFLRQSISSKDLGHKALAVNLSDIAAMGGVPHSAYLSLGLPTLLEINWVDEFLNGFTALAKEHGVRLLGGDTTRSPGPIIINVTILGHADNRQIKLRSAAQKGDVICVTGYLGDSGAGLKAVLENLPLDEEVQHLMYQHHHPVPHLGQGQWLAEHSEVRAMMDVSDGIHSDLKRIMKQSHCGASVNLDDLPTSASLRKICEKNNWNFDELTTCGGEDYCLLLTVEPTSYQRLEESFYHKFQTPLFSIGHITEKVGCLEYYLSGKPHCLNLKEFEHFPRRNEEPKT